MSIDTRLNPNLSQLEALTALDRQTGLRPGAEGQVGGLASAELALEAPAAETVDLGERMLNARAWEDGEPRQFAAGDFHPAGQDPADDLSLVDQVVASL